MEQVAVIHTAFEDTPSTVAFVNVPEDMTLGQKLEYAYRWTQNIFDSWSLKMPEDGNDDVTVMGDIVERAQPSPWESWVRPGRLSATTRLDRQLNRYMKNKAAESAES